MSLEKPVKRITTHTLGEMKHNGEKISMITAYDYSMARIVDEAGVDVILVGDSASNVMAGHETTLPITLDQMIYHASSVVRGINHSLVVVDLPFGTYQGNSKEALNSSIRIMKESGAHAVKLEGGREVSESISRILSAGIPVMGHLGLTPQSIYKFGTSWTEARRFIRHIARRMISISQSHRLKTVSTGIYSMCSAWMILTRPTNTIGHSGTMSGKNSRRCLKQGRVMSGLNFLKARRPVARPFWICRK